MLIFRAAGNRAKKRRQKGIKGDPSFAQLQALKVPANWAGDYRSAMSKHPGREASQLVFETPGRMEVGMLMGVSLFLAT